MCRKRLWWGLALGTVLLALLTLGQEPPSEEEAAPGEFIWEEGGLVESGLLQGPYEMTIDEQGEFLVLIPDLPGVAVTGSLIGYEYSESGKPILAPDSPPGKTLAELPLVVYLEPRPGTDQIRGPWDIGSAMIFDPTGQFETQVVTWLQVSVGFRAGKILALVSTGEVYLPRRQPCTTCQDKIVITGEDRRVVQFHWFHCEDGAWVHKGVFQARKRARLPEDPQPGQWVALVSEGREGRTYTFYRALEGQEPLTIGRTVPVGDTLPPDACQPCQYFLVEEGGTRLLYHCVPPGEWKLVREWKPPQERQAEEEAPPPEEGPPPPPEEEEPPPVG